MITLEKLEDFLNALFSIIRESEPLLQDKTVGVYLTDSPDIKKMNKKYFGRNAVTNILTFSNEFDESNSLGEIIINIQNPHRLEADDGEGTFANTVDIPPVNDSEQQVHHNHSSLRQKAILVGDTDKEEFHLPSILDDFLDAILSLFIHGLLHLLGYDHINTRLQQEMSRKEQYYYNYVTDKLSYLGCSRKG